MIRVLEYFHVTCALLKLSLRTAERHSSSFLEAGAALRYFEADQRRSATPSAFRPRFSYKLMLSLCDVFDGYIVLICKISPKNPRLLYNLYCVGGDVKPCSIESSSPKN